MHDHDDDTSLAGTALILQGQVPVDEYYSRALSAAWRLWTHLYDPDWALQNDAAAYEKVQRDLEIARLMNQRLHSIAGAEWHLQPENDTPPEKQLARICEKGLKKLGANFAEARLKLAQAVFRGRTYAAIEGERRWCNLADTGFGHWWVPLRLPDIDKRRVRFQPKSEQVDGETRVWAETQLFSIARDRWEIIEHPEWLVHITYRDEESSLGYGRPLFDAIYFVWWLKHRVIEEGLIGLERWAAGTIHGKVKRAAKVASTSKDANTAATQLMNTIHKMRSRHVIITDDDVDLEVLDTTGTGHRMVLDWLKWIGEQLASGIMGSTLPFGGGTDKGSLARAEVEQEESTALIQFDRQKNDGAIDAIIELFIRYNQPMLSALGLAGLDPPKFKTSTAHHEDPEKSVAIITAALGGGIDLLKTEVYQRLNFTPPSDEDYATGAVIEGSAAPAQDPIEALLNGNRPPGQQSGNQLPRVPARHPAAALPAVGGP